MKLTIQIITHNNELSIKKTLESIKLLEANVIVTDLGSSDKTLNILKNYNLDLRYGSFKELNVIRNQMIQNNWNLYLNPGEIIVGDTSIFDRLEGNAFYASVIHGKGISKEIRLWNGSENYKFINPIFETLDCETELFTDFVVYSDLGMLYLDKIPLALEQWKEKQPLSSIPYYYESLYLLYLGKFQEFENISKHFMFVDKNKQSISSIMHRYYYSLVQIQNKQIKDAFQLLNLCVLTNPIMAEFWCALGDLNFYVLRNHYNAKVFYENAMILGSQRSSQDKWPMDISKYKKYPESMINKIRLLNNIN